VTLDIELGEKLGVLELAPEDLALASYVCPSNMTINQSWILI